MQSSKVIVDLLRVRGWLTAGQLGRLVGISQTYMRVLVEAEDIETLQIGGIKRIHAKEIIRILHQYHVKNPYVADQGLAAAHEYLRIDSDNIGE